MKPSEIDQRYLDEITASRFPVIEDETPPLRIDIEGVGDQPAPEEVTPAPAAVQAPAAPLAPADGAPSMTAYDPTVRERLAEFLQAGFESFGMERFQARRQAQSLIGGPSSNLPLQLGVADIVPFLGTGLQTEEAGRMLGDAADLAQQGDLGGAALNAAIGAVGLIPGAVGTVQAARKIGDIANVAGDKAVQAITGNPQATAMGVLEEAGQMSPLSNVMPKASQIKIAPDLSIGVAPKLESQNFKTWFGDWQANPEDASKVVDDGGAPIVVYHGTQRPDRIGTQFRKSRATSGPMAFFTDRPELASSYATGKKDTSLAYENTDYANWFKKKEGRSKLNLDQVGARMSSQERQEVLDKLRLVGQDDQGNIVIGEPLVSDQTFDFMLKDPREAGGNPLKLANKLWLESGTLFGREEEFSKVLDAIGIKGFEQDFPTSSYPAVYPVYLSIKNPLDTSQIDQRTMYALEYNAKRQRKPRGSGGSDLWDKRMRDPKEWIGQLKEDMAEGKSSMVWTSIPDWVTATLKAEGYDGIKDVGGKSGGTPHTVWIPFDENQVKSATGNIGTYSLESKNILRGGVAGAVGATGAATMQDNEERM